MRDPTEADRSSNRGVPAAPAAHSQTIAMLTTAAATPVSPQAWFSASMDLHQPAADSRTTELLERRITRADLASTLFAGFIALLTGLNALYIGKAFGTLGDYVNLFLWAAGTKAGLDILLAVVDRVVNVQNPLSTPKS